MKMGELIDLVENTELEKNITLCLIKMHLKFSEDPQRQVPINFTSYVGDASLVEEILGEIYMRVDDFIGSNAFIQTPIWNATWGNHIDVVQLLMRFTEKPNAPRNNGVTPIYISICLLL